MLEETFLHPFEHEPSDIHDRQSFPLPFVVLEGFAGTAVL